MTKILFLSANPVDQDSLEVIKEFKKIEFVVKSAKYGNEIDIEQAHEVSLEELQNRLLSFRPRIVHFSGHGSKKGKLGFQNYSTNKAEIAPIEAIGNLFKIVNRDGNIRCVVLNACYSKEQAKEISKYVHCVIGTSGAILDKEAFAFDEGFYAGLANAKSIETAIDLGHSRLQMLKLSDDIIKLEPRDGVDPSKIYLIDDIEIFGKAKDYGLDFLPLNYFKDKTVTEKDEKYWKEGFEFSLTAIKNNLEYKREKVLNEINKRLETQNKLLLLGQSGFGKTTILYEILCHYHDKKDYLILYNWGKVDITRGDKLVEVIGTLLNEGIKIIVIVDDVHIDKTTTIFYIIDQLSNHVQNKNIFFLLAARLPDFDSLQDKLDQAKQGRESLRKFRNDPNNIYRLKEFKDYEIQGFITKYYKKGSIITVKSTESNKPITIFIDNDQSIRTLSILTLNQTDGHPIMIKFFLFRQGLRTDVETRYDDFLHGHPNRIKAMVVISLLDIANLQITDNLLASMQLLRYAYQLEHATLLYNSANGTWKTIHTRWDEELLSVLYDKSKKEGFLDRIELLEQVKSLVYQVEEIVYAVIGAVYEIAAKGIIPIDNVKSIFQIDSLSNKEKIKDLYVRYIGYAYFQLERYKEAIECYDKALEIDNTDCYVWYNIAMVLEKLGRYKEALACYKKTSQTGLWDIHIGAKIEALQSTLIDDDLKYRKKILEENNRNPKAWRDIGTSLHMQGQYGEALKCYDKALEIDNKDVKAWCYKGMSLDMQGQYGEALKCYDKALEIDNKDVEALHGKGAVLEKLQNENEALKCYDKALKIDDGSALLWYNKGIIHHGLKDYNEALKCYNRSLELNQNMIPALVNKALVLERLSRDNEALECYDKVLRLDPVNGFAMDKKRLLFEKLNNQEV